MAKHRLLGGHLPLAPTHIHFTIEETGSGRLRNVAKDTPLPGQWQQGRLPPKPRL